MVLSHVCTWSCCRSRSCHNVLVLQTVITCLMCCKLRVDTDSNCWTPPWPAFLPASCWCWIYLVTVWHMSVMQETLEQTVCIDAADTCLVTTLVAPSIQKQRFEDSGKACTGTAKCPFRPAGQSCFGTGELNITMLNQHSCFDCHYTCSTAPVTGEINSGCLLLQLRCQHVVLCCSRAFKDCQHTCNWGFDPSMQRQWIMTKMVSVFHRAVK